MILTNQIAFCTILKMTKVVLLLGFHVKPGMYMSSPQIKGQNVKTSEIPSSGTDPLCDMENRGLTIVRLISILTYCY